MRKCAFRWYILYNDNDNNNNNNNNLLVEFQIHLFDLTSNGRFWPVHIHHIANDYSISTLFIKV